MSNTVIVWGDNSHGEGGAGYSGTSELLPVGVPGLSGITSIAAGYFASFALESGLGRAWGGNDYAQLGFVAEEHSELSTDVPSAIPIPASITAISANNATHGLALYSNGAVWSWGGDIWGAVGNGEESNEGDPGRPPIELTFPHPVTAISVGEDGSAVLLSNGTVYTWGRGYGEEPGQTIGPGGKGKVLTPVLKSGLSNVTAIATGSYHKLAILNTGKVVGWGNGENGQLGNGDYYAGRLRNNVAKGYGSETPVAVLGEGGVGELSNVVAVVTGEQFSVALTSSGNVYTFGENTRGQCGTGAKSVYLSLTEPTTVGSSVLHVTGASSKGLVDNAIVEFNHIGKAKGIKADYEYYVVGATTNTFEVSLTEGGAGIQVETDELLVKGTQVIIPTLPIATPTKILSGVTAIAAGQKFALALKGTTVYGWGVNGEGETGTASEEEIIATPTAMPGSYDAIAIAAGYNHGMAILGSGTPPVPSLIVTLGIESATLKWITPSAREKGEASGVESCRVSWRPAKKKTQIIGNLTEGSDVIEVISTSWAELVAGESLTVPGGESELLPAGTTIASFNEGAGTVTMSEPAGESASATRVVAVNESSYTPNFTAQLGDTVYSYEFTDLPVEPLEFLVEVKENKSDPFLQRMGKKEAEAEPLRAPSLAEEEGPPSTATLQPLVTSVVLSQAVSAIALAPVVSAAALTPLTSTATLEPYTTQIERLGQRWPKPEEDTIGDDLVIPFTI